MQKNEFLEIPNNKMKIITRDQIDKFPVNAIKLVKKLVLFFFVVSSALFFAGCSFFQDNKKTKMVEPPPYYQQHRQTHAQHSTQQNQNLDVDNTKIFHRRDDEIVNVKVFRDTELEKLQRESVELDKMKDYTKKQNTQTNNKTNPTKKSWFASLFGNKNNNQQKNKNTTNNTPYNTPYLMSDKAKEINSNLH
ncbi:MAG: hypothetical protein LBP59_17860 [Planctomycetaceae bacterium]|nr:hypothetical protein [Planctomycetaceae bacterium]